MPKFAYSAIDSAGAEIEGTTKADTIGTARTLLVEQKLSIAMDIAHRVYVMGHGHVVFEGTPQELRDREDVRKEWLEV